MAEFGPESRSLNTLKSVLQVALNNLHCNCLIFLTNIQFSNLLAGHVYFTFLPKTYNHSIDFLNRLFLKIFLCGSFFKNLFWMEDNHFTYCVGFCHTSYRWLINTWKDAQHHSLLETWKSKLHWGIILHGSEWPSSKKSTNNKCSKGCGEKEPSCTVGGNVNWSSHYGQLYGDSLKSQE